MTRRRLALWSAPVWLVVVLCAVLLLARLADNAAGRDAYAAGDPEAARSRFDRTHRGNVLEPWVAAYNRGTAHFQLRRLPEARDDFAEALRGVPPARDCLVRLNLVATHEAMGDQLAAAGRHAESERAYAEGLAVLKQGRCGDPSASPTPSPSPSPSAKPSPGPSGQPTPAQGDKGDKPDERSPDEQRAEEQKRADEQGERVEDKREEQAEQAERDKNRPQPSDQPQPQDSPGSEQERLDRVEQQNQQSREQQQQAQDRAERQNGPRVERPW